MTTDIEQQLDELNQFAERAESIPLANTKESGILARLANLIETIRTKAGARHSAKDAEDIQGIHDASVRQGAACSFKVYKGEDGRLRWVTFSSTAYQDRDGEFVSLKALRDDVARADATGEYGPLRWWHMPGVDLGQCDFNMLASKVLIESGTFDDESVGERVKEAADGLGVSIGFNHPAAEPDAGGVFHTVRRFERSLLPAEKASNLFTRLSVKEKDNMDVIAQKKQALEKLIGKAAADALVANAAQVEKEADAAGVSFKAQTEKLSQSAGSREREIAAFARMDEEGGRETPKEFQGEVLKCMKEHLDGFNAHMGEAKEHMKAVKDYMAAHEKAHAAMGKKEVDETAETEKAERDNEIALLKAAVKAATDKLEELEGSAPRAAKKGYRASQDGPVAQQSQGPQPNQDFSKFMEFVATGK